MPTQRRAARRRARRKIAHGRSDSTQMKTGVRAAPAVSRGQPARGEKMTLYDAYGREVAVERLREEQAGPTIAGVRNIYSISHPAVGLTPEKLAGLLRQAEF